MSKCPLCGEALDNDAIYCSKCGWIKEDDTPKNETVNVPVIARTPNAKHSKRLVRLLVVLGIVMLAASLLVFFLIQARGPKIETLFPDEHLQHYIAEVADSDGNGYLARSEISEVTCLDDFKDRGIRSLQGLEIFNNLTTIEAPNAGIKEIWSAERDSDCLPNLKTIKLQENNLEEFWLEKGTCASVSTINVSHNHLTLLAVPDSVVYLNVSYNKLTSIVIPKGSGSSHGPTSEVHAGNLKSLRCSHNNLTGCLSISASDLETLDCSNNQLTELEFKTGGGWFNGPATPKSLKVLYCQNNALKKLGENFDDFGGYPFDVSGLKKYNISNNAGIHLSSSGGSITW